MPLAVITLYEVKPSNFLVDRYRSSIWPSLLPKQSVYEQHGSILLYGTIEARRVMFRLLEHLQKLLQQLILLVLSAKGLCIQQMFMLMPEAHRCSVETRTFWRSLTPPPNGGAQASLAPRS